MYNRDIAVMVKFWRQPTSFAALMAGGALCTQPGLNQLRCCYATHWKEFSCFSSFQALLSIRHCCNHLFFESRFLRAFWLQMETLFHPLRLTESTALTVTQLSVRVGITALIFNFLRWYLHHERVEMKQWNNEFHKEENNKTILTYGRCFMLFTISIANWQINVNERRNNGLNFKIIGWKGLSWRT